MQDENESIRMYMKEYMSRIQAMDLNRARCKQANDMADQREYDAYRSLEGSIIWSGNGVLSHAAFIGSFMQ